jgi:transcriptional regulator with XRE-family HTH domain
MTAADAIEQAVARRLKVLRRLAGLSQTALAERMFSRGQQWHQATVWKIEDGRRKVRTGELADLADILGVKPDALLSDDDYGEAVAARGTAERAVREQIAAEILSGTPKAGAA